MSRPPQHAGASRRRTWIRGPNTPGRPRRTARAAPTQACGRRRGVDPASRVRRGPCRGPVRAHTHTWRPGRWTLFILHRGGRAAAVMARQVGACTGVGPAQATRPSSAGGGAGGRAARPRRPPRGCSCTTTAAPAAYRDGSSGGSGGRGGGGGGGPQAPVKTPSSPCPCYKR